MNNPQVGDAVTRVFANGSTRPAVVTARGSVIDGIAYAAAITYTDGLRPRTASVEATRLERRAS